MEEFKSQREQIAEKLLSCNFVENKIVNGTRKVKMTKDGYLALSLLQNLVKLQNEVQEN